MVDRAKRSSPGETRLAGALEALDHTGVWVERPIRTIARSNRLNPLPHAGTISVFLLGIVVVSGLYITLFFEFGHTASYESVASMEDHAIQRVVRALHRYASGALVLTTLVHALRIFLAGRFTARHRRWRWASGVSSLLMVWLAGVSGYWLVWDVRAQALSEITIALSRTTGVGTALAIDHLTGLGEGSGAGLLLFLWFVHVLLTAVIGWFVFRHLRASKFAWLPARHWMLLMGGSLLIVSLAFPLGVLAPADPEQLLPPMPLDPFVLFLLPPLLSETRWYAIAGGAAILSLAYFLPLVLRRSDPAPIHVLDEACTGCELCVLDCPYEALSMTTRQDSPDLAVLDPAKCVACGICVGSCAFDAIEMPGQTAPSLQSVTGRSVVVACDRHVNHQDGILADGASHDQLIVPVRCAGVFAATSVHQFMEAGAIGVQLVGCPPGDCRYGVGNQLASQRLAGDRVPHPPRKWSGNLRQDWISPREFEISLNNPGVHPSADSMAGPANRERYVGAGILVALSVLGVAFATRTPFRGVSENAGIRVVVDHSPGQVLREVPEAGPVAEIEQLKLTVDGELMAQQTVHQSGGRSLAIIDWTVAPGSAAVEVELLDQGGKSVVFTDHVDIQRGGRLIASVTDVPPAPGAVEGREIFDSRSVGCDVCHSVTPKDDGVGPTLAGVASVADDRVLGLSAEQYLRQSIFLPDQYVVPGWPAGQMLPIYRDKLSEDQLTALIAYLMTLVTDGSS